MNSKRKVENLNLLPMYITSSAKDNVKWIKVSLLIKVIMVLKENMNDKRYEILFSNIGNQ
jgi:hypothetical protein